MMNSLLRISTRMGVSVARDRFSAVRPTLVKPTVVGASIASKRWVHNMHLTYDFVKERIMLVCRLYDKIDPEKITLDSHFIEDLGLDSLDHTEIIMELEDEFGFEIPDQDAEKLLRPSDILRYITDKEEAYEVIQEMHAHHDHGHDEHHHNSPASHHDSSPNHDQKRHYSTFRNFNQIRRSSDKPQVPTTFGYVSKDPIPIEQVQERVMKVCSKYDKIDSSKLTLASHFVNDLGLDSLDHVEIMMELEDEFGLEIPDKEAEKLMSPAHIAKYIYHKEEERLNPPTDRSC